jgi:hypothetical protein
MGNALVILLFAVAAIAWIVTVVSVVAMLRHRKRPLLWLAANGLAFFDRANFAEAADAHRRRFLWSIAAFAGAIAGLIVVTLARLA